MGFINKLGEILGALLEMQRRQSVPPTPPSPTPPPVSTLPSRASVRPWRLTTYYVAHQRTDAAGEVPILDAAGHELARVDAPFFAQMSLEGTGRAADGSMYNVVGRYVQADPHLYAPVLAYHRRNLAARPFGYSGIAVKDGEVRSALAFRRLTPSEVGVGFGTAHGKPLVPFRTVAADIGVLQRHEPRWKGQGGVCPVGTRVFVKELVGRRFPDLVKGGDFVHDGWLEVNDTGGGIFGCHFDVFVGVPRSERTWDPIPDQGSVWYEGIEERAPVGYTYGLRD